jgi:Cu+-exporting ATPase
VLASKERDLELGAVDEFDSPTGKGVTGVVDGRLILLGNSGFLWASGVDAGALDADAERLRADGATVINIAVDGKLAGLFAIADPVKQSTPAALKDLAVEGIRVIM